MEQFFLALYLEAMYQTTDYPHKRWPVLCDGCGWLALPHRSRVETSMHRRRRMFDPFKRDWQVWHRSCAEAARPT